MQDTQTPSTRGRAMELRRVQSNDGHTMGTHTRTRRLGNHIKSDNPTRAVRERVDAKHKKMMKGKDTE